MKLKNRMIAFILCVAMVVPCFAEIFPVILRAAEEPDLYVTVSGERITEYELPRDQRAEFNAVAKDVQVSAYRWQVLADPSDTTWANVYDMNTAKAEISYALFATILDQDNTAYIRAVGETSYGRIYSVPVKVTIVESDPQTAVQSVKGEPMRFGAGSGDSNILTITINYLSAVDGKQVYAPYVAHIAKDATYSQNVISPTQIGFAPFVNTTGATELAEGATVTVMVDHITRTYTYTGGQFEFNGTPETDSDWLSAIARAVTANLCTTDASIVNVSYTAGVDDPVDHVINVYYKPIDVPYSVRYYFQNINDDEYTQNAAISYNGMAETGTIVSDEDLYQPVLDYYGVTSGQDFGFSPLYHYPESVAADGSTVFECYYDRNYYLIKFDMDGGYGVEPIYARFGASFVVTPPIKAGYQFIGWDKIMSYTYKVYSDSSKTKYLTYQVLNEDEYVGKGSPSAYSESFTYNDVTYPNAYFVFEAASGDGTPDAATADPYSFIDTIKAESVSYKALWQTVPTTYTIVYWAENADDNEYSYWGNKPVSVQSATVLSDYDAIVATNPASGVPLTDAQYFTYNSAKTNFINGDSVIVEGDGSTTINVYYSRNTYDILFYDSTGSCSVPVHTHTDACYRYDCTSTHVHTAECCRLGLEQVEHDESCCSKQEHQHSPACLIATCPIEEHTHVPACYTTTCKHTHNADCCSLEFHNHTSGCTYVEKMTCSLEEHTHSVTCYPNATTTAATNQQRNGAPSNPQNGQIYKRGTLYNRIIYYNGSWYQYNGTETSGTVISMNCNKPEHTHEASCYQCPGYAHTHSVTCYPNATTTAATNQERNGAPSNPQNGQIYRRGNGYNRIIYYNGSWYRYNGTQASGTVLSMNCNKFEHTHAADGSCCTKPVHDHTSGCNSDACTHVCSLENGCIKLSCTKTEHTHSDACHYKCGKIAHTHTASCYTVGGSYRNYGDGYWFKLSTTALENLSNAKEVPVNGVSLWYNEMASDANKYLYYKVGNRYYQLLYGNNNTITYNNYIGNTTRYSTLTIVSNCTTEEHTHVDSCYECDKVNHTFIPEHSHEDGPCDTLACHDSTHHVHTEECLQCGNASEHVHSAECPRVLICDQPEHTHADGTCTSGSNKLVYKITAKYNADIHTHWPISGHNGTNYTSANGYRWKPQYAISEANIGTSVLVYMDRMPGMANVTGNVFKLNADHATGRDNITMHYCVQTIPGDSTATYVNYLGETATVSAGRGGASGYQFVEDYRRAGAYYSGITMDVDFIDLDGFTKYWLYTNANGGTNKAYSYSTDTVSGTQDYFYYLRNKYTLSFYNYNADWGTSEQVYYEQNMNPFNPGTPPYPSTLEPGAYSFVGWYTTPECYDGTEFDWTAVNKMPAKDVKLYAKYVPVKHTVRFFETYDIMLEYEDRAAAIMADTTLTDEEKNAAIAALDEELVYKKQTMLDENYIRQVDHGSVVGTIANPDPLVVENPGGSTSEYDFGGWFIIENEAKKAFTPLDMPITKDTHVFADWGTHTAQPYAVHYALENPENDSSWLGLLPAASAALANETRDVAISDDARTYICLQDGSDYHWHLIIANDTRGYAYQGTTRTFNAKAGNPYNQLFGIYNVGYFPTPSSHSITMVYEEDSLEPKYNVFTFRYVYVENVSYTVRYVDAATGEELLPPKVVENVTDAVVTERFKTIPEYVPDAFYKPCILAVIPDPANPGQYLSSPENVITFYYTQDDSSARYSVHFLLQKSDPASSNLTAADFDIDFDPEDGTYSYSSKFEESGSRIDAVTIKDTEISIYPMDFAGFDLITTEDAAQYDGPDYIKEDRPFLTDSDDKLYTKMTPVVDGTDLFFFYTREKYPYKVYYLLYGSPITAADLATYTTAAADTHDPQIVLADTDGLDGTLKALYGTNYSATAKNINGYTCISQSTITKAITPNEESNFIVFFYTPLQYTVQYQVVGVGGTVDNTIETVEDIDDFQGSTATANPGYEFVGWFVDEECTIPATYNSVTGLGKGTTYTDSTKTTTAAGKNGEYVFPDANHLLPNGHADIDDNPNIFYAKFTSLLSKLTIERENSDNEGEGEQTFVYEVKNETSGDIIYVTLQAGEKVAVLWVYQDTYTVTQIKDWSHRFGDETHDTPQTVTVPSEGITVTFDDAATEQKWLNGNSDRVTNIMGE